MPRRETPKLSEALVQFLAIGSTHVAQTTLENDRALLRKFVREVGDIQVHQLGPERLEGWFAGEAARQMPSSYNKVRTRVATFLGFARDGVGWRPIRWRIFALAVSSNRNACASAPGSWCR